MFISNENDLQQRNAARSVNDTKKEVNKILLRYYSHMTSRKKYKKCYDRNEMKKKYKFSEWK